MTPYQCLPHYLNAKDVHTKGIFSVIFNVWFHISGALGVNLEVPGPVQPFVYGVQCSGQESELLNCSKSEVMKVSCESVAGIVCQGIQNRHHLPFGIIMVTMVYVFICTRPSTYMCVV